MIYNALLFLHLIICAVLILVVLLQSGKGGGLAGAFGASQGGAGQNIFGGRGAATFLSKATTMLGIAFMVSSLVLAILSSGRSDTRSVIRDANFSPGVAPPPAATQPLALPDGGVLPTGGASPDGTLPVGDPGTADPGTSNPGSTDPDPDGDSGDN